MRKRIYMLQGGSSVRRHLEDRSLCSGFSARTSFSPGGEEKETLFIRFINFPSLTYSQNNDLRCTAALITLPEVFVFSFTRRCPSKGRCREAARRINDARRCFLDGRRRAGISRLSGVLSASQLSSVLNPITSRVFE